MNYKNLYDLIIERARHRQLDESDGEYHHVNPRAVYGDKNNNDIVLLTYREHFIVHKLLVKIYEHQYGMYHSYTRKMKQAVHRMVYGKNKINVTSFDFEIARRYCREAKTGVTHQLTEEAAKKKRLRAWYKSQGLEIPKNLQLDYRVSLETSRKGYTRDELKNEAYEISTKDGRVTEFFLSLTDQEFKDWINSKPKFVSGRWGKQRPNPNVTRALSIRRVPFKEYYKESDYSKSWFGQRIHQVLFYGE